MTTIDPAAVKRRHKFLKFWHAWMVGSFVVAYATADIDSLYAMHLFSGYCALGAIAARLALGLAASGTGPMALPRPSLAKAREWLVTGKGRNPGFALFAAALLILVGLSGGTGAIADSWPSFEDLHEGVSEAVLWVIVGHVGFIALLYGGKQRLTAAWARFHRSQMGHKS